MGAHGCAPERHRRRHRRPVRGRSIRRCIPDWAAPGVARVERCRVFPGVQCSQFVLLPDHRGARAASDGRPGGLGQNDCEGVAWRRARPGAPERGALRHLLAFPAVGLARLTWSADGLDGRFCRYLSPVAQLEGGDQMAETALANTGESPARMAGWRGIAADWSSDQRAFKNVSWGKAMMWIFLLSDTFIFSCLLLSYLTTRMSTT